MILLAPLVRLPAAAVGWIGLLIVLGQQAFRYPPLLLPPATRASIGWIWEFVYPSGEQVQTPIAILYVIVPWIGVMAAGYGFGLILLREPARRRRQCLTIGLACTTLFLILGSIPILSRSAPPDAPPALFRLLSQQKYPASQIFLFMTLGPTIALIPLLENARLENARLENARGWLASALTTFGRVPMFYYLLHIPLIHGAALAVTFLREGQVHPEWYATAPFAFMPPPHRWSLPLLYLVWAIVIAILYFACRWFAGVKARHPSGVLRYI